MAKFGLFTKKSTERISLYGCNSEEQAKQYFIKLKNLPEKEFDKIFIVKQIDKYDK